MFLYTLVILIYSILNIELIETKNANNFLFLNKTKINTIKNKNFSYRNEINNNLLFLSDEDKDEDKNKYNKTAINRTKIADEIFQENEIITFPLLLFSCFIILYGAYYYKLALIIHFGYFLFYIIILSAPPEFIEYKYCLFIGLFSLISGILISIFISTDDKRTKKYTFQKLIYSTAYGFFFHKIVFYYIVIFIDDKQKDTIEFMNIIYYISFPSSILLFGFINFCYFPDNLIYLFCSIISGSFYIIHNIDCIINTEKDENGTFYTNIIIQVIIVVLSIIYQFYHLNYKTSEEQKSYISEKDEIDVSRISTSSYKSNQDEIKKGKGEKEQELIKNPENEDNYEEEEINDKED